MLDTKTAYRQYLKSQTWQNIKATVLAERGNACERCGSGFRIEVHHRQYPKVRGTETPDMLEVLCHKCHLSHHIQTAEAVKVTTPPKVFPKKWWDKKKKIRYVKLARGAKAAREYELLLSRGRL